MHFISGTGIFGLPIKKCNKAYKIFKNPILYICNKNNRISNITRFCEVCRRTFYCSCFLTLYGFGSKFVCRSLHFFLYLWDKFDARPLIINANPTLRHNISQYTVRGGVRTSLVCKIPLLAHALGLKGKVH